MDAHADFLIIIAVLAVGGKLAGQVGRHIGLPTAVGKITLGLIIGPAMLGIVHNEGAVIDLASIGVIILMFLAGLETDTETMRRVTVPAFAVAIGGVVFPFLGGLAIGAVFQLGTSETLFLGAILTATSVSISAQTLRELGHLRSRTGTTILAAAVIDDILGIIVLAFVFASTGGDPLISIGKMAAFLPLALVLGQRVLAPLASRALPRLPEEAQLAVLLGGALSYSWAAEHLGGVAAVTGAYMAGLIASQTEMGHSASRGLNWMAYGFFVPIFFVAIGLQADFVSLGEAPLLVLALLAVAVITKVGGCFAGARMTGFTGADSLRVGVGMISRGEVGLIVASAGITSGIISNSIFTVVIVMVIVSTLVTPPLLRLVFSKSASQTIITKEESA